MKLTEEIIHKLGDMKDGKIFLKGTDIRLIRYFLNQDLTLYFNDDNYEIFRTKVSKNDCLMITDESGVEYGLLVTKAGVILYQKESGVYLAVIAKDNTATNNMQMIRDTQGEICKYHTVKKSNGNEKYTYREEINCRTKAEASLSAIGTEHNNKHYFEYRDANSSGSLIESLLNTVAISFDDEANPYEAIFSKLERKVQKQNEQMIRSRKKKNSSK